MNPEDFIDLIRAHQAGLYRYVKFLGNNPGEAREIVHDSFVKAYYGPTVLSEVESEATFRLLRKFARELHTERKKSGFFNGTAADPKILKSHEDFWDRNVTSSEDYFAKLQTIKKFLDGLPEKPRQTLEEYYLRKLDAELESEKQEEPAAVRKIHEALVKHVGPRLRKNYIQGVA